MSEQDQQQSRSPLQSDRGVTTIKDSVVQRLAGMAAGEVEGVYMGGGASRTAGGVLEGVTGSDSQKRGVSVEVGRTEAAIDLTMGIDYGRNILDLVGQVRNRITQRVEGLTGLRITELNVTVSDIIFKGEDSDGEEERRGLESGPSYEERPQVRRTEETRTDARESRSERRGPLDEDETRELRVRDEDIDETRRIPAEDETGRERRRDRRGER